VIKLNYISALHGCGHILKWIMKKRWEGHVAGMGVREVHKEFSWRDLREGGDHLEDIGVDEG
jgi:hypothetical protein